jgi:hypothetical protein
MDNPRKIFPEHLSQLTLDLALDEFLDDCYGIKRAVDINVLEWVSLKYQGNSLLLGDNEHDDRA